MGFYTRIIPPGIVLDETEIVKTYFIIDRIDIQYVTVNDKEDINLLVTLNSYNSYEERLSRGDLSMSLEYTFQDFIDKDFSENLWMKCYIKIKEEILNQNTEILKEALSMRELEQNPPSHIETVVADDAGVEIAVPLPVKFNITVDTIPTEYLYLLEIDDHFN